MQINLRIIRKQTLAIHIFVQAGRLRYGQAGGRRSTNYLRDSRYANKSAASCAV